MSFKKGDVVQLKSGGPEMTISGIIGEDKILDIVKVTGGFSDGDIVVEYFNKGNLEKNTFKATSVQLIEV